MTWNFNPCRTKEAEDKKKLKEEISVHIDNRLKDGREKSKERKTRANYEKEKRTDAKFRLRIFEVRFILRTMQAAAEVCICEQAEQNKKMPSTFFAPPPPTRHHHQRSDNTKNLTYLF